MNRGAVAGVAADVRSGSKADIEPLPSYVRFTPERGHKSWQASEGKRATRSDAKASHGAGFTPGAGAEGHSPHNRSELQIGAPMSWYGAHCGRHGTHRRVVTSGDFDCKRGSQNN